MGFAVIIALIWAGSRLKNGIMALLVVCCVFVQQNILDFITKQIPYNSEQTYC